ncbi:hypothetical protein [Nostoc sp. DedQUE02]|nr:hypothetical protein [Nostoc sp. DedQUE02]
MNYKKLGNGEWGMGNGEWGRVTNAQCPMSTSPERTCAEVSRTTSLRDAT